MYSVYLKSIFENQKSSYDFSKWEGLLSALTTLCDGWIMPSRLVGLFVWALPWWQANCTACGTVSLHFLAVFYHSIIVKGDIKSPLKTRSAKCASC